MKRIIFFDLDGTLIDTSERHYVLYKDILELLGMPNKLSKKEFWKEKRIGRKTVDLLPGNSTQSVAREFSEKWLEKVEDTKYLKYDRPYSESLSVLSELESMFDLVLVTLRQNERNLFWELGDFGLTKYFKEILFGSPLIFEDKVLLIQEYMKTCSGKRNGIVVGDSEVDINTGKKIGMLTVAVTYGIRSRNFVKKLKPSFCANSLREVLEILKATGD